MSEPCPNCGGTGQRPKLGRPCGACNGSGQVASQTRPDFHSTFSPSPWTADDGDSGCYGVFDYNGGAICYLMEPHPSKRILPEPTPDVSNEALAATHIANAKLIASAPCLVEALRTADQLLTMCMHEMQQRGEVGRAGMISEQKAINRAALTKAGALEAAQLKAEQPK